MKHCLRSRHCSTFVSFRYYICWPRSSCPQSTIFSLPKCVNIFQQTGASSHKPNIQFNFLHHHFYNQGLLLPFSAHFEHPGQLVFRYQPIWFLILGFLKYAVYRKHTHTHTHTHTVQKLKQKISATVTSISEDTLAGVM